jgi:WD40 repeat protein
VDHVSWSPRGGYLATGGFTSSIDVWDAADGRFVDSGPSHDEVAALLAWSPDGSRLVSGGDDAAAKVWEVADNGAPAITLSGSTTRDGLADLAFSPAGDRVMTSSADRRSVTIWDVGVAGSAEVAALPAINEFGSVEFAPDGQHLFAPAPSGAITLWDLASGRPGPTFGRATDQRYFDVSPDGTAIAVASDDRKVVPALETSSGARLFDFPASAEVDEVSWSPDGRLLAMAAHDDGTIVVDRAGDVVARLPEPGFEVLRARFSPDGRWIAVAMQAEGTGTPNTHVSIWEWERGGIIQSIPADATVEMEFDPSGERIVAVDSTGSVRIWNIEDATVSSTLAADPAEALSVDLSPDGARIATGNSDGTVRVFDARSGAQLLVLPGHELWVSGVDFSPDGRLLATQGPGSLRSKAQGVVRVWALDVDDLLEIAGRSVTRSLTDEECRRYLHQDACQD